MSEQLAPGVAPARMDIFLRQSNRSFKWVAAAETLGLARQKIVQNPDSSDYTFLIVNSKTGERTIIDPSEQPPEPTL